MFPFHDDNPIERTPLVTYVLIAINVLAFLWSSRLPPLQQERLAYEHGFVPARMIQLRQPKEIHVPLAEVVHHPILGNAVRQWDLTLDPEPSQIWLSLLTCMFLHGGWMHLLGNMWFLWLFGDNVEDRLGPLLYLFLYFLGGVLASLSHWWVNPASTTPVIGASGAIAAVLGAYAITWPWARVSTLVFLFVFVTVIDIPALIVLGAWFLIQVFSGEQSLGHATSAGVAWWAHVGGFVTGMILMPLLSSLVYRPPPPGREEGEPIGDER